MRFTLLRKKRVSEKFPIGVDFTRDLNAGDSLFGITVTAADDNGDATAGFTEGAILSGNVGLVTIKNGTAESTVTVTFKATTAAGYSYEHDILVSVSAVA